MIRTLCLILALGLTPAFSAAEKVDGKMTYDLLFRNGTLDMIERDKVLVYSRSVSNSLKPDTETRDTGEIALSFQSGEAVQAFLQFRKDDKHRGLGRFPASVGNPMIMYFYETTIRDMAEAAGGSPFYIRNRVKDALVQPTDVEDGEVLFDGQKIATKTIRLYPFEDDPNRERMEGFGDLELKVVMSDAVPGWYMQLTATAGDVYRSEVTFRELEAPE